MKRFVFVLVVVVIILVSTLAGIGVSLSGGKAADEGQYVSLLPKVTFIPIQTYVPLLTIVPLPSGLSMVVNIPDPNLNQELHLKVGKPMSQNLTTSDLAGLTGALYLVDKNISNAEGIQYCTNISSLLMEKNNLTSLPNMKYMNELTFVSMKSNKFTSIPSTITNLVSLERLNFARNYIEEIPAAIANLTNLTHLNLNQNKIDEIPIALYNMSGMKILELGNNDIDSISSNISGMNNLEFLAIYENNLESLPTELFSLSRFKTITASSNSLYSLPNNIAGSNIEDISVDDNRITRLPSNIGSASHLKFFDVSINRLRNLPSSFDDKDYTHLALEFNFLDVSVGSSTRAIIDNTTATVSKYYKRQLKPIDNVTAVPTDVSIALSWDAGEDGAKDGATWDVNSYKVYDALYSLAGETLPNVLEYQHTGLTPQTTYIYHVGVEYHLVLPSYGLDKMIRAYTDVKVTTLPTQEMAAANATPSANAVQTPVPAEEEMPQEESEAIQSAQVVATPSTQIGIDNINDKPALPIWSIVLICVVCTATLGTGGALVLMKVRAAKGNFSKRA